MIMCQAMYYEERKEGGGAKLQ